MSTAHGVKQILILSNIIYIGIYYIYTYEHENLCLQYRFVQNMT